jgi:glucose-1-phosphate thymidylyltransferase
MCAKESLSGPCVIAYADTLFRADFTLDPDADAVIWVQQVKEPSAFGVVKLDASKGITELVEKPEEFVSNLAVIGIYYFKEVAVLKDELQQVLDKNIMNGGEYQINDGIKGMMAKGMRFVPGQIDEWMDCGNKAVTVETNARMLNFLHADGEKLVSNSARIENTEIIEPCYIGEGVVLTNAKIGPHVSIGNNTKITNSTVVNSLIQTNTEIKNAKLNNAMIGNHAKFNGDFTSISIGDYSVLE